MASHVSLQVTRLGVQLLTAGEIAGENLVVLTDVRLGRRIFPDQNEQTFFKSSVETSSNGTGGSEQLQKLLSQTVIPLHCQ